MTAVDPYARYQAGLTMSALYPYRTDRTCRCGCGKDCTWEAHHKTPVSEGGGGCDLDGFETRCSECHSMPHGVRPTANREQTPESGPFLEASLGPV